MAAFGSRIWTNDFFKSKNKVAFTDESQDVEFNLASDYWKRIRKEKSNRDLLWVNTIKPCAIF